jgi:hypothetical protein
VAAAALAEACGFAENRWQAKSYLDRSNVNPVFCSI